MQSFIPYKCYILMEKREHDVKFQYLAKQVKNLNVDFFLQQIMERKKSYFVRVILSYHFEKSLALSLDLGTFPRMRQSKLEELSQDQQRYLKDHKKNPSKDPPKLISSHEKDVERADFILSLLYMCTNQSCFIVDVLSIVEFQVADVFSPWVNYLQKKRAESTSALEGKMIKNLCECPCPCPCLCSWIFCLFYPCPFPCPCP